MDVILASTSGRTIIAVSKDYQVASAKYRSVEIELATTAHRKHANER